MEGEKKVLVTGITGFLGSHIVLQLLQKGYSVRGTVRDKSNTKKLEFLQKFPHQDRLELVEADLLKPDTLKAAVKGCTYVIHAASPYPMDAPKDESTLTKPAVEGTMGILNACKEHPEVQHVVVTSSIVAVISLKAPMKPLYDEKDWAETEGNVAYNKSKTLAEKAAWDFYAALGEKKPFKLTVINPGFILGPALFAGNFTSAMRIKSFLNGAMKVLFKLSFCVVDVRDVATAHIAAIEHPESSGQRYICYSGETLELGDVAGILREEYGKYGYKIPDSVLPACPIKDPNNPLAMYWGKRFALDNSKIKKELGVSFVPAKESVLKMAQSLIELGDLPNLITKPAAKQPVW